MKKAALLVTLLLLVTSAGARATESWQAEWAKTLDAARKEGSVVVSGPPGELQRTAITSAWAKAYPDIKLDYTGARGTQVVASVVRERASGIYNWDVIIAGVDPTVFSLVPINALAPLRSALIQPDLTEDKTWIGGFASGFLDDQKKYFYSPIGILETGIGFANRACFPSGDLTKLADLTKPEFKGKIAWFDPTLPGFGARSTWLLANGEGKGWLKQLLLDHDVTFSRDYHQMADWLVSCTKPVALGIDNDVLVPMKKAGLGAQVEPLAGAAYIGRQTPGWGVANDSIGWYNNAPHPNAAKIFVNWYLSKDFQQFYADSYHTNSRRTDTKPGDPDPNHTLHVGVAYKNIANEAANRGFKSLQADIKQWGIAQ